MSQRGAEALRLVKKPHLVSEHSMRLHTATLTGLEPATSAVTGRHANQLRYRALLLSLIGLVTPTGFEPVLPP